MGHLHRSRITKHARHTSSKPHPALLLIRQLLPAYSGNGIELGVAALPGDLPFGGDPAVLLHTVKRRVERSFLHLQKVFGDGMDVVAQAVAVKRATTLQRAEHE